MPTTALCSSQHSQHAHETMRLLSGAALLATVASSVAAANVLSLTDNNYEQLTAGKPVFIKFFAPCKSDRPIGTQHLETSKVTRGLFRI